MAMSILEWDEKAHSHWCPGCQRYVTAVHTCYNGGY